MSADGFAGVLAIIMCKAPVAGRVKTRLTPTYSTEEAAAIHRAMAETVIARTSRMFPDSCIATDDVTHPFFKPFALPLVAQGEGDLGARMSRLMLAAFNDGAGAVLFLGTDSPHMPDTRLTEAVALLTLHDVVIGPVEDGGYDLIATRRPCPGLFDGIAWGSGHVLRQTLQKAEAASIDVALLDESFDLDTPASLERAKGLWQPPVSPPCGTDRDN